MTDYDGLPVILPVGEVYRALAVTDPGGCDAGYWYLRARGLIPQLDKAARALWRQDAWDWAMKVADDYDEDDDV